MDKTDLTHTQQKPLSTTAYVIKNIGLDELRSIWMKNGHKRTAKIISQILGKRISRDIIRYIAIRKNNWKRKLTDKSLSIYKAVESGKIPANYYRSIIFIEDEVHNNGI